MKIKDVDIYYFSGTGNTLLIAQKIQETLRRFNCPAQLMRLEKTNPAEINLNKTIGLMFPVAFQSTYPFIWSFFENLPHANGTEIFMVDTLGLLSGAIVGPLKVLLESKGFSCIAAKEILMPSNMRPKQRDEQSKQRIIDKGLVSARVFAHDLFYDQIKWGRIPFVSDVFNKLSRSSLLRNNLRKKVYPVIDKYKCIKCGICYNMCPVDNITVQEYPDFSGNCQYCLRCLAFCPTDAINLKNFNIEKYKSVESKDILV